MPDYTEKQIPEREFFIGVLATIYPKETEKMVDAAFKARQLQYRKNEDNMIEVTKDIKEIIDSVLSYKSKIRDI